MSTKTHSSPNTQRTQWYYGADVPKTEIRRFAREVAEQFRPDKILLFGSHAYGKSHADSDVDVLVIMRCRNQLDQAVKISLAIDPPFPLDIIVRTPHNMTWRLAEGDSFLEEIVAKGKVLYEAPDGGMGAKRGGRFSSGKQARGGRPPRHDAVCFHCQQSAEKYLKALLQDAGIKVAKTHNLVALLPWCVNLKV